eukprot:IDg5558t1
MGDALYSRPQHQSTLDSTDAEIVSAAQHSLFTAITSAVLVRNSVSMSDTITHIMSGTNSQSNNVLPSGVVTDIGVVVNEGRRKDTTENYLSTPTGGRSRLNGSIMREQPSHVHDVLVSHSNAREGCIGSMVNIGDNRFLCVVLLQILGAINSSLNVAIQICEPHDYDKLYIFCTIFLLMDSAS